MGWTIAYNLLVKHPQTPSSYMKKQSSAPSFQTVPKRKSPLPHPLLNCGQKNAKNSVTNANLQTYIPVFITSKEKKRFEF